ncbi:hypothetical protein OG949_16760 [Streptomyces scopuliridis]|uniref:hypothetical protein n=1 Tax=Streptomyces scopuliridis TaxID=452529 RepID=UPI002DD9F76A|nr:hypothetical protein [Streptomyces scopuliridis]WSB34360.1 hypothetical protein OG949_16760 [Streptomyces scopuliridis]
MPSEQPFEAPFEDGLGEALRRTGETFAPTDRAALVDAGLTRGRRRVARRRAATVTGSVLALAAVGIGGAYGGGLLGGGQGGGHGETSVAAPDPTPTGPAPTADADLIAILTRLLPGGELKNPSTNTSDTPGYRSVRGVFDDGKGDAEISVGLTRADGTDANQQVTCPDKVFNAYDDCAETELADGSRLMVFQGYEYPDRREDTKNWRAVLLTSDGFLVDASEYNAPAEKGAEISRADPPLNPAQLKTLVTSDAWRAPLNELPTRPSPRPPAGGAPETSADPDGVNTRKTLVSLLPAGLKVTDDGGQEGFGYLVVDDGKGLSYVQVNVQPGMSDDAGALFPGATTLPDGTLLKTTKKAGEKGVGGIKMWTADTLRPDGLRVVISAFNAADQVSPATRGNPALTMKQLTAIATSQKWLTRT